MVLRADFTEVSAGISSYVATESEQAGGLAAVAPKAVVCIGPTDENRDRARPGEHLFRGYRTGEMG